jgi:hypothetical protein
LEARALKVPGTQRSGFAKLLGVPEDDLAELLSRFGDLVKLPIEVRAQLKAHVADADDLTTRLPTIEEALANVQLTNAGAKWSTFKQGITDLSLDQLKYASRELTRHRTWPTAAKPRIDELLQRINDLIADAWASEDLDAEAKFYLLDHLQRMRDGLERFAIVGPQALQNATESFVGSAVLRRGVFERIPPAIRRKVAALIAAAVVLVPLASDALELSERVQAALGA